MKFPHLKLIDWPFRVVPKDEYCNFIAGRKEVNNDVSNILKNWSKKDLSTLNIIWAYYGAGKTHTLKYITNRCINNFNSFIPIYMEFPKSVRSFLGLYSSFIEKVDIEKIQNAFLEVFTNDGKKEYQKKLKQDYPDLFTALTVLIQDKGEKVAWANYWLRADNVSLKDLRSINITSRIDNSEKALKVITWLINLLSYSETLTTPHPPRIIWMIDEFQRITRCRNPIQDEINGCLQSIYNRCPSGFSLILSFSGEPSEKRPDWLSKELVDRIGMEKVIILPPLTSDEAEEFIMDVLFNFRPFSDDNKKEPFPFTAASIRKVIDEIKKQVPIKPRSLMQGFNVVMEEADNKMEDGKLKSITESFVEQVMKDRVFLDSDDEDQE